MSRTLKVLIAIAITVCAVQICSLAIDLIEPAEEGAAYLTATLQSQAVVRWQVYWFSGALLSAVGLIGRRRYRLTGDSLAIGGVYLMLLGNNGGLLSTGHVSYRLATSLVTFVFLIILSMQAERSQPHQDSRAHA